MKEKDLNFENKLWKAAEYEIGFARMATIEEIAKNGFVLTPGRFVGIKLEEEEEPYEEKMQTYSSELTKLFKEEKKLNEKIREVFNALGWRI